MKIFVTLGDIVGIIILVLFIVGGIIYTIFQEFKKIGKKNCYKCKHYELYDVTSVGGYCRMRCKKHNRIDKTVDINDNEHYEKCKNFLESKEE